MHHCIGPVWIPDQSMPHPRNMSTMWCWFHRTAGYRVHQHVRYVCTSFRFELLPFNSSLTWFYTCSDCKPMLQDAISESCDPSLFVTVCSERRFHTGQLYGNFNRRRRNAKFAFEHSFRKVVAWLPPKLPLKIAERAIDCQRRRRPICPRRRR